MLASQLTFLCEKLGNPNLEIYEKWKSIKYIFVENPIVDVQKLLHKQEIMYIDNPDNGAGFYIIGYTNSDLGVPKPNERVVTFIPLKLIDKISIVSDIEVNDETDRPSHDENNLLYVNTLGDTLVFGNVEAETYEDIIIINNAIGKTDNTTLIIDKMN